MSPRRISQAIIVLLFVLVIGTPLFYLPSSVFPYNVPKTAFFQSVVEVIFFLWLARKFRYFDISIFRVATRNSKLETRNSSMTPLRWAIAAFLTVLTVTAFTGVDPVRSFFSTQGRAFGVVTWYHLAALALVISSLWREIPWKKVWYASFGTSIATAGIALLQLKLPHFLLASENAGARPGATFGNATFLAGYLLVNVFMAGYFMFRNFEFRVLSDRSKYRNIEISKLFLSAVILLDLLGIFLTQTRGDILGLFAGVLTLGVLFAVRPPRFRSGFFSRRAIYVGALAVLILLGAAVWFTRGSSVWDSVPGINRLKNLSLSGQSSDIVSREIALGAAWKGFLERPLTGFGFENFNVVFNARYDPRSLEFGYAESDFDKPHDVPLEMIVSGGALLLLAYLAILAFLIYEAWKSGRVFGQVITALAVAYFVRSLVFFDTIGPAMVLFLAMGFIDGKYRSVIRGYKSVIPGLTRDPGLKKRNLDSGSGAGMTIVALCIAFLLAYFLNFTAVSAAYHQYLGDQEIGSGPNQAIADFHAAADGWSPYQWEFTRDSANTLAESYSYSPGSVPKEEMQSAIASMERVAAAHPNDAYNQYLLADIYNLAYDIDPKNYLANAEREAQTALQLSPNRQEIYFYLARTKSLEGDVAGAEAMAKQALDFDPNVADSHFYYGMLAFANGKPDVGYAEVKTAIGMNRPWHNFYEPRTAADYFADSGHLAEAIGLYQAALVLRPDDLESEIKLGVAYFVSGDRESARKELQDAAARFDFSKSPAYPQLKPVLDNLGIH